MCTRTAPRARQPQPLLTFCPSSAPSLGCSQVRPDPGIELSHRASRLRVSCFLEDASVVLGE